MSCPQLSTLQAHVEGFASDAERALVVAHLASCAACRELVLTVLVDAPNRFADSGAVEAGLEPGQRIDRYVTLEKLGEGGMGVVYAAYDAELDRKVAVKLIRPGDGGEQATAQMRERLLREAQAMARVAHPNVASVYDVGRHGQQVFVTMELVPGETLALWLTRARRSASEIVRVFVHAGRGLAAAHAAGLVHRDFKPNNVMIDDAEPVRVLDFGLARPAGLSETGSLPSPSRLDRALTGTGALLGTPAYMAPEQLAGEPTDTRTDQFSFCVALYEALCDVRPFVAADTANLRVEILERRRQRSKHKVPRRLLRIVERGLEPSPPARWPSMEALLAELEREPQRRRQRWLVPGAVALVLALATAGLVSVRRERARACRVRAAAIDSAWSETRRQAVHAAFIATHHGGAEHAFEVAARQLDAYAQRWQSMSVAACEATTAIRARPDESAWLRDACLDNRLAELRSLVGVFAAADSGVVERALTAATSLSSIDDCADAAALGRDHPLPADPARREQIQAMEQKLAELQALNLGGRFRDTIDRATTLEPAVLALHHRPTEATLRKLQAVAFANAGDLARARSHAELAILAAESTGDGHVAVDGWRTLVRVADQASKGDDADAAFRHGLAWADRLGDDKARADLLLVHGESLSDRGRGDEAVAEVTEAARLAAGSGDGDLVAQTMSGLAGVLDQAGRHAEARKQYERAIAVSESRYGPQSLHVAVSLENLGTMLLNAGDDDGARPPLERALGILEVVHGPTHAEVAYMVNLLALLATHQERYADAETLARRALAIFEKTLEPGDPRLAFPLNTLGLIALHTGRPQPALPFFERALALREKADVHPSDLATSRENLGMALVESGRDRARGLDLVTRARAAFVQQNELGEVHFIDTWLARQHAR